MRFPAQRIHGETNRDGVSSGVGKSSTISRSAKMGAGGATVSAMKTTGLDDFVTNVIAATSKVAEGGRAAVADGRFGVVV